MKRSLPLLLLLLACACSSSKDGQERDHAFGNWQVMSGAEKDEKLCYAGAFPVKSEGTATSRASQPYLMITRRPGGAQEVSASAGYTFKPGSRAEMAIDEDTHSLFFRDNIAWAYGRGQDRQIIKELQTAQDDVEVRGLNAQGQTSVDSYSLTGFNDALARMRVLCP